MRIQFCLLALGTVLLAANDARCADQQAAPETSVAPTERAKTYDELFGEILQNLPEKNRAKVDSARANGKTPPETPAVTETKGPPDHAMVEKREKALEKLSPDVKARVEKAIKDLENRRKDRDLEFKELDQ